MEVEPGMNVTYPLSQSAPNGRIGRGTATHDLLLATVRPHAVGFREAIAWSAFYIAVAVVFGVVFASLAGWGDGAEYFAGCVVEKSVSVDNLFVFVIIMATFAVPREH
jgi:tellurite resistance protein TerC